MANPATRSERMRVALGSYRPVTDEFLRTARQFGVHDILVTPHRHDGVESVLPLSEAWSVDQLRSLQGRIEENSLNLFAVEKMPIPLYEILLDIGDREEKLEILKTTIRNMGEVGIPVLGYSGHPPDGAVRTTRAKRIRGGAEVSAFDEREIDQDLLYDRTYDEEELWTAYEIFLKEIVPVAEEAGVTLGVHPSDPPVEELGGVPLLFRSFDNFKRAMELVDSENHGLKFCLGCWSEMGADIPTVLRHFGGDNIIYVHFRDVIGTVPEFHETFIDDDGSNFNEYEVMRTLHEIGFTGVMTPDHVPLVEGDNEWEFGSIKGRLFTIGYLKGMLKGVRENERELDAATKGVR